MLLMVVLMTLNAISIVMTVFILCLHHKDPAPPIPPFVRKVIWHWLGRLVCYTGDAANTVAPSSESTTNLVEEALTEEKQNVKSSVTKVVI